MKLLMLGATGPGAEKDDGMKAIRIEQHDGPEVLQPQHIPVPDPSAGEVLVRMAHAGINVLDVGTRKGAFANSKTYPVRLPTTIGTEGAGTVERVGAGVTGFHPGDRVAYCLVWNSHAEFAVLPVWQLVHGRWSIAAISHSAWPPRANLAVHLREICPTNQAQRPPAVRRNRKGEALYE